ncbi:hypothetical protein [Novosphingobium olei]|uniref:hypothetical protein n=1 Tax=Novosphingobium olei TaxID=2728851 RepID=UPI00308A2B7B|nr:hypothetical protein NSDW_36750 [Novosphingobium olei]
MARPPQTAGETAAPARKRKARRPDLPPVPPPPVPQAPVADDPLGEPERSADPVDPVAAGSIDFDDLLGDLAGPPNGETSAETKVLPLAEIEEALADAPDDEVAGLEAEAEPALPSEPIAASEDAPTDLLDDILNELPAPAPAPDEDPLDAILGELSAAPAPPSAEVDPLDDILGALTAAPAPAEVAAVDPLDDILGELAAAPAPPAPLEPVEIDPLEDILGELPSAPAPVAAEVDPLDDILGELPAGPVTPAVEADPLDDILGELPAAPAAEADPLDDILGELAPASESAVAEGAAASAEAVPAALPPVSLDDMDDLLGEMDASAPAAAVAPDGPDEAAAGKKRAKRKLPAISVPPRVRRLALVGTGLVATHALAFWLGSLSHVAANPEGPAAGASAEAEVHEPPVEGIARFAGKPIDARIDGQTMFESEEFRSAVDELVGGQEAASAIEELLPTIRATEPIVRKGETLSLRGCNPASCGLENLTVHYDIQSKRVEICTTRPSGDPAVAMSTLYDEQGAREVENCEGYPHPPQPKPKPKPVEEAEPDNPADLTFSAKDADHGSISDRIHAELEKLREGKKRKRRYE